MFLTSSLVPRPSSLSPGSLSHPCSDTAVSSTMNAAERLELADPLQHLSLCNQCHNAKVSAPQLCRGHNYPEHIHRWYEVVCSASPLLPTTYSHDVSQCLNNFDSARPLCKYLGWRNDIPDGKPPRGTPQTVCPGRLCTKDGAHNAINLTCLFGLCEACCADAHELLAGVRSCSVLSHRKAVGKPRTGMRFFTCRGSYIAAHTSLQLAAAAMLL